jgi:hypothetical protein
MNGDETIKPAARADDKEESNKITMTLPPAVIAAMRAEGQPLDMSAGEWAKHHLIAAYTQPGGVTIKLRPVTMPESGDQLKLPLGGLD